MRSMWNSMCLQLPLKFQDFVAIHIMVNGKSEL